MRTKHDPANGVIGAKLAFYSEWGACTSYPNTVAPDPEFYDYNQATTNNAAEIGNDYFSSNLMTQKTIQAYTAALGAWGPPATGIVGSELNAPLVGTGTTGSPLTFAQSTAQQQYYVFYANATGSGPCTG